MTRGTRAPKKRPESAVIRDARSSDAADVAALMTELGYPTTPRQMASRLRSIGTSGDYHSVSAVDGDEVIGFVGAMIGYGFECDAPHGRIIALAVKESWRRRGIGTLLVAAAEEWLSRSGAVACIINSGKSRFNAHGFYRSLGYRATGIRFAKAGGPTSNTAMQRTVPRVTTLAGIGGTRRSRPKPGR